MKDLLLRTLEGKIHVNLSNKNAQQMFETLESHDMNNNYIKTS